MQTSTLVDIGDLSEGAIVRLNPATKPSSHKVPGLLVSDGPP
jgi:hypothetical protein